MSLQEKYKNYKTPLNEEAWDQFQQIRKRKKEDEKGAYIERSIDKGKNGDKNSWLFLLLLLFVGVASFLFYSDTKYWNSQNSFSQNTLKIEHKKNKTTPSQEQKAIANFNNTTINKSIISNNNIQSTIDQVKNSAENKVVTKITKELTDQKLRNTQEKIEVSSSKIRNNLNTINKENSSKTNTTSISSSQIPSTTFENRTTPLSSSLFPKQKLNSIVSEPTEDTEKNKVVLIIPSLNTLSILLPLTGENTLTDSSLSFPTPIIKATRQHSKKNHLKLTGAYADYYWNGINPTVEKSVEKKGGLYQLEYSRNLNAILGIGASLGYSKGKDINNPQLDTIDFERIRYAHLNLYLHLLNTPKYRLQLKIGSGITQTKRVSSFFILSSNVPPRRGLQINDLTDLGLLVEGSLERRLYRDIWLGITYGVISHNDGAWYTGLSVGYNF